MRLLHEKNLLLRVFTQNIDSLEKQAGLPPDAIVAAHGNFDSEFHLWYKIIAHRAVMFGQGSGI
jgi:Sir2 family